MNKKGFTLIELLAVLGLLTIIALLGVPILLNQIDSQKQKNYDNFIGDLCLSAEAYINHTDNIEGIENFKEPGDTLDINVSDLIANGYVKSNTKNPKTKENIQSTDIITVSMTENKTYSCTMNGQVATKYKEAILNGAVPVLRSDMVPVTIADDGTVRKADTTKEWYKYADKKWANAVVLSNPSKYINKGPGKEIEETDIKAYYVWIPRYRYQLFESSTPIEIQIKFENKKTSKSTSTTVGEYLTHPAFTYGTEELSGFWVGKFETTGTSSAPTIKPNTTSLRSQTVSEQYTTSLLVSNNSRMMKNDEWGAVAYLTQSKYGKNSEVRINNKNGDYKTGCGASEANGASTSTCQIEYGKVTSYPQSTTENINGIFDMSGGSWEYVMAVRSDSSGNPLSGRNNLYNSGFNGKFGCPTCDSGTSGVDSSILELTNGTNFPDSKNYNLYDNSSNRENITGDNGCNGLKCYGYALTETTNWNDDHYYFPSKMYPWVVRGGDCSNGANAGVFSTYYYTGRAYSYVSFRTVVTP